MKVKSRLLEASRDEVLLNPLPTTASARSINTAPSQASEGGLYLGGPSREKRGIQTYSKLLEGRKRPKMGRHRETEWGSIYESGTSL